MLTSTKSLENHETDKERCILSRKVYLKAIGKGLHTKPSPTLGSLPAGLKPLVRCNDLAIFFCVISPCKSACHGFVFIALCNDRLGHHLCTIGGSSVMHSTDNNHFNWQTMSTIMSMSCLAAVASCQNSRWRLAKTQFVLYFSLSISCRVFRLSFEVRFAGIVGKSIVGKSIVGKSCWKEHCWKKLLERAIGKSLLWAVIEGSFEVCVSVSAIITFGAVDRISACPRIGVSSLRGDGSEELVTSSLLLLLFFACVFGFLLLCFLCDCLLFVFYSSWAQIELKPMDGPDDDVWSWPVGTTARRASWCSDGSSSCPRVKSATL